MKNLLQYSTDDINVIYKTKLHWISYVKPTISIFLALILCFFYIALFWESHLSIKIPTLSISNALNFIIPVLLICWCLSSIYKIIYYKFIKIYITGTGVTLELGILSKEINDIELSKYEGMSIFQSFLGRVLDYGKLTISTGEIHQTYQIEKPLIFRKHILEQIKK